MRAPGLNDRLTAREPDVQAWCIWCLAERSVQVSAGVEDAREACHWGVIMGTWFWVNFPLALLFVCCWAGIPLWLTLTRWRAELGAKHAEVASAAGPTPAAVQSAPVHAKQASSPAYAPVA